MSYKIKYSSTFKSDYKSFQHKTKVCKKIDSVILKLAQWLKLDNSMHDHILKWDYKYCRECHVMPDILLIYKIQDSELILLLVRLWSHSDLF